MNKLECTFKQEMPSLEFSSMKCQYALICYFFFLNKVYKLDLLCKLLVLMENKYHDSRDTYRQVRNERKKQESHIFGQFFSSIQFYL